MKSMLEILSKDAGNAANIRTSALSALDHRFSHGGSKETYLSAVLAFPNGVIGGLGHMGYNIFSMDIASWTGGDNHQKVRDLSERFLKMRRRDADSDLGVDVRKFTNGDVDNKNAFLLGISLVDRFKSRDVSIPADPERPLIKGYMSVIVFTDQSAANSVTPIAGNRILVSNAPFEQNYSEVNLYEAPDDPSDYKAFGNAEKSPYLDLLHLSTVMTADQSDLDML